MITNSAMDALRSQVASRMAVPASRLKALTRISMLDDEMLEWARGFCKTSMCFSNALNMSEIDGCDVVLGYVHFSDLDMVAEHAWNACDTVGGDFDLTAQLFWGDDTTANTSYFQLIRLSDEEAKEQFLKNNGIDSTALRKSPQYQYLFREETNV